MTTKTTGQGFAGQAVPNAPAILDEPAAQAEDQNEAPCSRVRICRSPRWCRVHLRKRLCSLAPSGICLLLWLLAEVHHELPWLRGMPLLSLGLFTLFGLSLTIAAPSFELQLDLPPLEWRKQARKEWMSPRRFVRAVYNPELGDDELSVLLKCPGYAKDVDYPTPRVRYRCGSVEYEVRGYDVWVAPASAGTTGQAPSLSADAVAAPQRVLQ